MENLITYLYTCMRNLFLIVFYAELPPGRSLCVPNVCNLVVTFERVTSNVMDMKVLINAIPGCQVSVKIDENSVPSCVGPVKTSSCAGVTCFRLPNLQRLRVLDSCLNIIRNMYANMLPKPPLQVNLHFSPSLPQQQPLQSPLCYKTTIISLYMRWTFLRPLTVSCFAL